MPQGAQIDERSLAHLLDRSYPVMILLAGSVGARSATDHIVASWEQALTSDAAPTALEKIAFRALLERLTEATQGGPSAVGRVTDDPTVDRFEGPDSRWEGFWRESPVPLESHGADMDERAFAVVSEALNQMPLLPRAVTLLRDFAQWSALDVASLLGAEPAVQRALLGTGREFIVHALEKAGKEAHA